MFQEALVNSANSWMREQQNALSRQAMDVEMLKGRVAVLEQARPENHDIDVENNVVMRAAPPLALVQAPPVHYAAKLAKYIVDERYEGFLTELSSHNMRKQMQLDGQQQQFRV